MAGTAVVTREITETWFRDQVPESWFSELEVLLDRDELLVMGTLAPRDPPDEPDEPGEPEDPGETADTGDGHIEQAELAHITWFREETRGDRVDIALRAEAKFRRKVSWGTKSGSTQAIFTHQTVPVMTRLRIDERQTLDTLIAAGVARSRSDALAWCVRRLGDYESDWLEELQDAISSVDEVRAKGPT